MNASLQVELIGQVNCMKQAEFAIIGTCEGFGCGIISWHSDEQTANLSADNLRAAGGNVRVIDAPAGCVKKHARTIINLVKFNNGDTFDEILNSNFKTA